MVLECVTGEACEMGRISLLALADSVNPCAMAVLTMVLVSILTENPQNKKRVLWAGLAFSLAIFISYLIYGVIIVQFFKTFSLFLRENSIYIYKALALLAIGIGILNVKDYFAYKKGNFLTEMPLFMRPKIKRITNKITSPTGAFIIGFIVTLFLLPCTMGPYIIASGLIAGMPFLGATMWLVYYNLIFILPMIIITLIVYFGFSKVEEVSGWKERNIKKLHLIAGSLLILVGILIFKGWI